LQDSDEVGLQEHKGRFQRRRQKAKKARPAFGGPESAARVFAPPRTETEEKDAPALLVSYNIVWLELHANSAWSGERMYKED
jgi:hypothetical protein